MPPKTLSEAPWWFLRLCLLCFTFTLAVNICALVINYSVQNNCISSVSDALPWYDVDGVRWALVSLNGVWLLYTFWVTYERWGEIQISTSDGTDTSKPSSLITTTDESAPISKENVLSDLGFEPMANLMTNPTANPNQSTATPTYLDLEQVDSITQRS